MTDQTQALPRKVQSAANVKKRYQAETRFRAYGTVALGISVLFLGLLITDIVRKSLPAFQEYKTDMEVTIDPAMVDAKEPRKGDYDTITKDAFRAAFPGVTTRAERKKLMALLSSGAADDLRDQVVANPSLIGTKITAPLLLVDDADLYLKDFYGETQNVKGAGALTFAAAGEAVSISGDVNGLIKDQILSVNGGALRIIDLKDGVATADIVTTMANLDPVKAGDWRILTPAATESNRRIGDAQLVWLESLRERGLASTQVTTRLFTSGDSREAELSGLRGAIVGSLWTVGLTLLISLPLGVAAAIYLEEFAAKNRFTSFLEVNINNLAAVPSIIFGLLGLAIFLNFFHLPRSAPLVGGLVLALLVLPTIIIASRAAVKAVPPSIKEAALGVGASHQQAVFHHVLPLAVPGILTGTILGVARALGETAPLLMIGMVAFIVDVPGSITDAATVLPVQIYLWSDLPEQAYEARTAAAIVILLTLLFCLNALAIYLRRRFEMRW